NNLKFGYFGVMADTYANMQDRLMWLYKEAMKEFLGEKITFVSNEDIEKDFKQLKIKTLKEVMQNYIKELKFYSNNDFAFLEVHNKELFLKNALVLKEIVELFANYKLTQNSTNQFLGNLFELFLQKGMKQDEGQFFTPIQICEFIMYSLPLQEMLNKSSKALRVIDYACGAGHFLNTYANELKRYLTEDELKEHYKNIYGIEKEYRLSKVSKVSSAMYGQNEINILYADALASFELANTNNLEGEKAKPQIESNSFDLLIANPPYSVKGFLETLSDKSKNTYKLFNDDINIETNNSIECFFCERANQILNDNAKAAIILPSSILNKDSIYKNTREILFQNFDFIAIVELGNQTFGATGTNTIILFLRKKETFKQENHLISQDYSLIKERIEAENLKDNESFYQNYLNTYCDFRKFDKELYSNFLNGNLDSKLAELEAFKDYRNAFRQTSDYKKLKESKIYKESEDKQSLEDKAFLAYAQAIEKDKLLYFSLSLNQEVLIIKSPSDIKEQKKFLGYEWSNRKGDEGLKELHEPYLSPLFERGNPQNETKLNTLICKAFLKTLSDIPKDLQGYASKARLIDMMDFEKVEFNKAISLNVKSRDELNPFKNSKYELVRLGEVCDLNKIRNQASATQIEKMNLNSGNVKLLPSSKNYEWWTDEKTAGQFINEGEVITLGVARYANIKKHKGKFVSANNHILSVKDKSKIIFDFLYILLEICGQKLYKQGQQYPQFDTNIFYSFKIPLPPLEIQKQIVAECEKIEEQHNTLSLSIKEYQKLIKAMLQKCGIIEDNQEYELNSILENLQKLESKLDFNLLFSFIDDFTNARQEDLKKFKEFVKNTKAILGTFSTPPKQGWNKEKLNEIVSIQSGGTPDRKVKEYWNGNINWVKSEVCQNCYVYDYQVKEKITELGLQKSSAKLLKKETTLIALVGATIGKIGFLTFESATNQNITGLYPKNLKILNTKYLYYACMGLYGQFRKLGDFAMANSNFIKNLTISLPPLEIQEKIVQNIELVEQQIDFLNLKLEFLEKEKEKILQKYLFS
ncbi:restriction endonuclease subunit S, partial [Campylobacter coli]|uniref:restriction endonuclease subunit S n=1 Tax=Campylobacter coli TaxID=195 RepID=UPI0036F28D12